ncbi:MAG: lipoprotein signal peptidase [Bacteroidota bacterium]
MLKKSLLIIFLVLFIDQVLKIWIKTHMALGDEIHIAGNWFIIHFTENEGMAFGMRFGGGFGKLILSLFRIVAVGAIGYYILKLIKENADKLLIICMSFIFAGAVGNILDSAFYGLMFNESYFNVAKMFPAGGGYAAFLHGKVVDMLYFPLFNLHFPSWIPFIGGKDFEFFEPVFNIADSSITIGVIMLILFQRRFFKKETIIAPETTNEDSNITE